jgi:hypothetical protein
MTQLNAATRLIADSHKERVAKFRDDLRKAGIKAKIKMNKSSQFGEGVDVFYPTHDGHFSDHEQETILKIAHSVGARDFHSGEPVDVHARHHFTAFHFAI